jgi:hypothetical protein
MTYPLWRQLMKDSLRTIESETRAAAQHELIDPMQAPRIYALVELLRDTLNEIGGTEARLGEREATPDCGEATGDSAASRSPSFARTRVLR